MKMEKTLRLGVILYAFAFLAVLTVNKSANATLKFPSSLRFFPNSE